MDGIVGTREIVGIARKSSRKNSIPIGLVPGLHIPRGSRGVKKKDFSNTYIIVYISLVFVEWKIRSQQRILFRSMSRKKRWNVFEDDFSESILRIDRALIEDNEI